MEGFSFSHFTFLSFVVTFSFGIKIIPCLSFHFENLDVRLALVWLGMMKLLDLKVPSLLVLSHHTLSI